MSNKKNNKPFHTERPNRHLVGNIVLYLEYRRVCCSLRRAGDEHYYHGDHRDAGLDYVRVSGLSYLGILEESLFTALHYKQHIYFIFKKSCEQM
jgi:hypothetical protein